MTWGRPRPGSGRGRTCGPARGAPPCARAARRSGRSSGSPEKACESRASEMTAVGPSICAWPKTKLRTGMKRSRPVTPRIRSASGGPRREERLQHLGRAPLAARRRRRRPAGSGSGASRSDRAAEGARDGAPRRRRGPRRRAVPIATTAMTLTPAAAAASPRTGSVTRKRVPLPGDALDLDVAAVRLDDAVDDGEAEADPLALVLRREERVEDPLLQLGRHPLAVVLHLEDDLVLSGRRPASRPGGAPAPCSASPRRRSGRGS